MSEVELSFGGRALYLMHSQSEEIVVTTAHGGEACQARSIGSIIVHRMTFGIKITPRGRKDLDEIFSGRLMVVREVDKVLAFTTTKRHSLAWKQFSSAMLAILSQSAEINSRN